MQNAAQNGEWCVAAVFDEAGSKAGTIGLSKIALNAGDNFIGEGLRVQHRQGGIGDKEQAVLGFDVQSGRSFRYLQVAVKMFPPPEPW